jgi:hypothetical protein
VLVINLDGDGTPAPGAGGGEALVAKGRLDGDPKPPPASSSDAAKPPPPKPPKSIVKPPKPTPPKPVVTPPKPAQTTPPTSPPKQISYADFQKDRDKNTKPTKSIPPTKPTTGAKRGARALDISRYGRGASLGVEQGTGLGGSPKGGGATLAAYEDRLKLLIQQQFQALVNEQGGSLAGLSGEFQLRVSNNGNLSFSGWTQDPKNALFERLLRQAIDRVRNIGPRPAGSLTLQIFKIEATPQ